MLPNCSARATLAQLVERLIRNQQVAGSTPAGGSIKSNVHKPARLRVGFNSRVILSWSASCAPARCSLFGGMTNRATASVSTAESRTSWKSRPKTEGSDWFVWLPASVDTELEFWRGTARDAGPNAFIFPSSRGTAINTNNFLFRVLKEAGRNAGIQGVTHQMPRRTCSTYMAEITGVKDVQAHPRHTNARTTLEHYIKSVPESVRIAVDLVDRQQAVGMSWSR